MQVKLKECPNSELDKPHPSAGGSGGVEFDSGSNPSGVAKIHIECGSYDWDGYKCQSIIKRVFLEFMTPANPSSKREPTYNGYSVHSAKNNNTMSTLELAPCDEVIKVVVWTDGIFANAVQFHTDTGIISQRYGICNTRSKAYAFKGEQGAHLAGVYGRFGGLIDSLGFTFATDMLETVTAEVYVPKRDQGDY